MICPSTGKSTLSYNLPRRALLQTCYWRSYGAVTSGGNRVCKAAAMDSQLSVAVVGAGAAGLVAARELLREGHSVTVFEQGSDVGGVWRYMPETEDDPLGQQPGRRRVHSSMYKNLRTNLPREIMGYSDFPFLPYMMRGASQDNRQFCGHLEVYNYLKSFTLAHGLERHILFNTQVVRALPVAPAAAGDSHQPAASPNGISTSHQGQAASDDGQASVDGQSCIMPTAHPQPATDGGRNWYGQAWQLISAPAVSGKLAEAAQQPEAGASTEVFDALVVCNGHYSEPRLPDAQGAEHFAGRQMHTHNYREAAPFAGQRVVVVGASSSGDDISREIAQTADQVYLSSRTWSPDMQPVGARGNIHRMPAFQGFNDDGSVRFAEDQQASGVDTVVYATGYVYKFPFLEDANVISIHDNRVGPLYQHMWPPAHAPSLLFIGIPWKVVPFPLMELQSRWAARVLSGKATLPPTAEMRKHVEELYAQMERDGIPTRFTHRFDQDVQWQYNEWVRRACGPDVPKLSDWRPALYAEASINKHSIPERYRDTQLDSRLVAEAHAESKAVADNTASCAA